MRSPSPGDPLGETPQGPHGNRGIGEVEKVGITGDDSFGSDGLGERDQVVVLRIAEDGTRTYWVGLEPCAALHIGDEPVGGVGRKEPGDLRPAEDIREFRDQSWTHDVVKAAFDASLDDPASDTARRDRCRNKDPGVEDDKQSLCARPPTGADGADLLGGQG